MCYIAILYYRCTDKRIEENKRKQHEISSRIRYGIFLRFVKGRKKWYNTAIGERNRTPRTPVSIE